VFVHIRRNQFIKGELGMTSRRAMLGVALVGAAFTAAGCGVVVKDGSKHYPDYRYRLSVEVDTPEGVKRGSSVIEVSTYVSGKYTIPDPGKLFTKVRGDAVTVDLGTRGVMFALLRSEYSVDWAAGVLSSVTPDPVLDPGPDQDKTGNVQLAPDKDDRYSGLDMHMKNILKSKGVYDVPRYYNTILSRPKPGDAHPPSYYPIMVTFKDMSDPKSVTKVDPDALSATFGKGVSLKRITVERTQDPVTTGIQRRLGWLEQVGRSRSTLIPNPPRLLKDAKDPIIQYLSPSNFSTELYK
jgi:hypothetical protein